MNYLRDEISSMRQWGYFLNISPLDIAWTPLARRWGLFWSVQDYEYTANRLAPMTFITPNGTKIQPDKHFSSDMGSIPPPLQGFPTLSKDRFLPAYLIHDSACRHGGLWFKHPNEIEYTFRKMTRLEIDQLLNNMIGALGGNTYQRQIIFRGARIGALCAEKDEKIRFPHLRYAKTSLPQHDSVRVHKGDIDYPP